MSSFLMNCPQCNAMIAKGYPCPECHWSEQAATAAAVNSSAVDDSGGGVAVATAPSAGTAVALNLDALQEFGNREKAHIRNFAIHMALMLGTGLIGLLTAYMWFRFLYLGDVMAIIRVGVLTFITAGLGLLLTYSKKLFPVDLNCPSCGVRIDQVGLNRGHCPGCSAHLK